MEFKALLYIPDRPPYDMFDANDRASKDSIRLYVRRVLLKGHFEGGLLPRYLGFITGIVDSDDLPINISRETLQESKSMDLIRKKLVRKTLEMLKNLMKDEEKEVREAEETEKEKEDGKDGGDGEENAEETTEKKKTVRKDRLRIDVERHCGAMKTERRVVVVCGLCASLRLLHWTCWVADSVFVLLFGVDCHRRRSF